VFNPEPGADVNVFVLPEFRADLRSLPYEAQSEFRTMLRKADWKGRFPGKRLESRKGTESLDGWMKCYMGDYRVVFKQSGNTVAFIAIGERCNLAVYRSAAARLEGLAGAA
jgi:mRNA-degrading endonuclease RelE of RelBE toxin-antitoxin system